MEEEIRQINVYKNVIPEINENGEILVVRRWKRKSDKLDSTIQEQVNINQTQYTEK